MLFHTPLFAVFFVALLAADAALHRHPAPRKVMLLLASYGFYMAWDVRYLALLGFSTLVDYVAGELIFRSASPRRRKLMLAVSVAVNLGVLGLFKYYGFFVENFAALLRWAGFEPSLPALRLILPVGISFYTFQTMSYTIEIYRGSLEPRRSLVDFALFVSFFPQLVAGPIVRAAEFLPQLERPYAYDERQAGSGLYLILKGLTKKAIFADVLGVFLVDRVFEAPHAWGGLWIPLAIYAFKFQIYGDFSGYSDIAIGCGRLLGFELPANFRSPYKAVDLSDYWRRWHMTLGRWFRDFVFYPLGGSRRGEFRTNLNVMLTMTLVGLWHGAAWTFVLWGAYYGALICIERAWQRRRIARGRGGESRLPRALRVAIAFQFTALGAFLFRSSDLENARAMARAAIAGAEPGAGISPLVASVLAVAALTHFLPRRLKDAAEAGFVHAPALLQALALVAVMVAIRLVGTQVNPFYYFQF